MSDEGDELRRLRLDVEDLQRRVRMLESGGAGEKVAPGTAERQFGLTAVNRIGALTLAIGIIFFFKYAADNEWIGRGARLTAGVIAGAAMLAAAEWLARQQQRVFAQGIAGCGLAALYISSYAGFAWYRFFSEGTAAAALVAVSGLAVWLSFRYAHLAIAGLGFTGGLLTPLLLEGDRAGAGVVLPYLFLIDFTCVVVSSKRRWPLLAGVVAAEAAIAAFFLTPSMAPGWFVVFALMLGAVHLGATGLLRGDRVLHDTLYGAGHGLIVAGLLREVVLWTERVISGPARSGAESEFGSLFLAAYGIGALAVGIARHSNVARTLGLVLIGVVIGKLYLWDVWFLERLYRMSAFGGLGILLLAASWVYSRARDVR